MFGQITGLGGFFLCVLAYQIAVDWRESVTGWVAGHLAEGHLKSTDIICFEQTSNFYKNIELINEHISNNPSFQNQVWTTLPMTGLQLPIPHTYQHSCCWSPAISLAWVHTFCTMAQLARQQEPYLLYAAWPLGSASAFLVVPFLFLFNITVRFQSGD